MSFFDISLDTANSFYKFGWRLSLLGAVITATGIWLLWWGTRVRDHDFEQQIAGLNLAAQQSEERAAALEVSAEQLRVKVAEANKEAAKANQQAAEARLALANFRAPRLPTPEQLALVTNKLKAFTGTQFDTGLSGADREAEDFLWRLEPSITDAGWVEVNWVGPETLIRHGRPISGKTSVIGVRIEMHPEQREKFLPAAEALAAVLKDIGIAAGVGPFNTHNNNPSAIHMMIGSKP